MSRFKIFLTLLFLVGNTSLIFSQKYNIQTYSLNDGLPSSQVYDVIVDDFGYAWFATSYGLAKFDGLNFITYGVEKGLKDLLTYDIHIDSDNEFWVSTEFGGVANFIGDTLIYNPELSLLDTMIINYISDDDSGNMWFNTNENGIIIWNKEKGDFSRLTEKEGLPSNQIWDSYFDKDGKAWIATMAGVAIYEPGNGITRTFTKEDGMSGVFAYQITEMQNGERWVSTSNGISIIKSDYSIETLTSINGFDLEYVYGVEQSNDGLIWIGTERDGLFWIDEGKSKHITKRNGLSSNYIYRLINDGNGTIWVATDGNGVSIFKDREFRFYDSGSNLDANSVFSAIKKSDGSLWFGTENGLSSYKNGNFTNYKIPEKFFNENEIWDIEELPNGNLLFLLYDYETLEFDGKSFFRPEFYDQLFEYYFNDIFVDDDGSIWFAAYGFLIHYKDGAVEKFKPPSDEYWQIALSFIYKDSKGYLWIGTEGGLAKFNGADFNYYKNEDGLLGENIYEIIEDEDQNLWVGTGKGISIINVNNETGAPQRIESFDVDDIYEQETIFLQFDNHGGLWQGTNNGLNYYSVEKWRETGELDQLHFPLTDHDDGLEFNGFARILDDNGDLWFGSATKGLINYKFPDDIKSINKINPPAIFLREFRSDETVVYNQLSKRNSSSNLTVDYHENNLEFQFNAIDYKNPDKLQYRYRLKGFDTKWLTASDINEIRYTNIPAGNYELLMSAKSIKSDWSETASLISFRVNQPFWKSLWFILTVGLAITGIVIMYINYRIDKLEKKDLQLQVDEQTKHLREVLDEKEVLIKEIHHRVKNNLAVISGLLELQSWSMPDGNAKQAMLESKMRILAMSKIHENLYQHDDLARVDFKKFLEDLVNSITTTMASNNKVIEVINDIDSAKLTVNLGIPIGLVTNELVSNSFKHAFKDRDKGTISISFKERENSYQLVVKDDGIGFSEEADIFEKKSSSLGMNLVSSLSGQIGAELDYNGEDGAYFAITIPK